ncbi:hypothetical protein ACQRIT_000794 [Beauveria bassiana]
MSNARVSKSYRSSTQRRHDLISRIEKLGLQLLDMGRCTPCREKGSLCFVLKGYTKCSSCIKRNVTHCDGNFSVEEFDHIESQKERLRQEAQRKRQEVGRLAAAAAAAYSALAQAQQEEINIASQLDRFSETQSRMLRQEAFALDSIDEPSGSMIALEDPSWMWDEALLFGGTAQAAPSNQSGS